MNIAVILAAGKGTRVRHADKPKQYLDIGGKPILCHTVGKFLAWKQIDHIVVAVHRDWVHYTERLLADQASSRISVCEGADNRQESLLKALLFCQEQLHVPEDAIIVSHDAARPFVTEAIINENIQTISNDVQAVTTVIPAVDTIIKSTDGVTLTGVTDRHQMYQVQTPQTFRLAQYIKIYQTLDKMTLSCMTDVSRAFYSQGLKVALVLGDRKNLKITTDGDLLLAGFFLEWNRHKERIS